MAHVSSVDAGNEADLLGRVITRLRDDPPTPKANKTLQLSARDEIDASVAAALADPVDEAPVTRRRRTRTVSRMATGEVEEIPEDQRWPYAGLAPMTRVRTSFGDVYAVALRKGDLVKTRNGEFKPIVWLDRIMLEDEFLQNMVDSNPILLPAGSVARGLPRKDVLVSPRQIIPRQGDFMEMRDAGSLVGRPNVRRKFETSLSYTIFHTGETEDVLVEGMYLRIEV